MKELLRQDFSSDILQLMPDDKLAKFIELCTQNIPKSLCAHHILLNYQRWKHIMSKDKQLKNSISPKCKKLVFAHRDGKVENCTFIVVNEEAYHDNVDVSKT